MKYLLILITQLMFMGTTSAMGGLTYIGNPKSANDYAYIGTINCLKVRFVMLKVTMESTHTTVEDILNDRDKAIEKVLLDVFTKFPHIRKFGPEQVAYKKGLNACLAHFGLRDRIRGDRQKLVDEMKKELGIK